MSSGSQSSSNMRLRASDSLLRLAGAFVATVAVVAMLMPPVIVIGVSFSDESFFSFPPHDWGFRQYRALADDPLWRDAFLYSLKIGVPVAICAVAVVVPAVFAIHRSHLPGRQGLHLIGLAGIIVPITAFAVAMYGVFVQFGLLGTYIGLVCANLVLAIPVVLMVTTAAMSRIPVELELAAMVAGASRTRAWLGISARLLAPAIAAGAVLAFVTSFDEAVFISFLGGPGQTTLPRAILNSVQYGLDPVVTAIAALLMVGTGAMLFITAYLFEDRR